MERVAWENLTLVYRAANVGGNPNRRIILGSSPRSMMRAATGTSSCNRPMICQMADETLNQLAMLDWHEAPYASFAEWVIVLARDG